MSNRTVKEVNWFWPETPTIEPKYSIFNRESGTLDIGLTKGGVHKFINDRDISQDRLEEDYSIIKYWVEDGEIRCDSVKIEIKT